MHPLQSASQGSPCHMSLLFFKKKLLSYQNHNLQELLSGYSRILRVYIDNPFIIVNQMSTDSDKFFFLVFHHVYPVQTPSIFFTPTKLSTNLLLPEPFCQCFSFVIVTLLCVLSLLTDWSSYHLFVFAEDTISLQFPQMCLVYFLMSYKARNLSFLSLSFCLTLPLENHISYIMSNLQVTPFYLCYIKSVLYFFPLWFLSKM